MSTSLVSPDSIDLLTKVSLEKATRPVRFSKLPVHFYKPSSFLPDKQIALSGTVTLFLGRKGSKLFKELAEAVLRPGRVDDKKVAVQLNHYFARRKQSALEEIVSTIRAHTVISDLRYGGGTLVENIILPADAELAAIPLPYNGGRLAKDGFTLAEYFIEYLESDVEVLLVVNEPPLTDAERVALEGVPEEMLSVNVGKGPGEVACSVLLLTVAVVVEVAVVAATFTVVKASYDDSMDHINPNPIKELGSIGTARMLVNLRRDILQGRTGRWQKQ